MCCPVPEITTANANTRGKLSPLSSEDLAIPSLYELLGRRFHVKIHTTGKCVHVCVGTDEEGEVGVGGVSKGDWNL